MRNLRLFLAWLSWNPTLDINVVFKRSCAVMSHVADSPKNRLFSTPFRGVLPRSGPQISAESGSGHPLSGTRETWLGWHLTSTWPLFSRSTPPAPRSTHHASRSTPHQRGQVVRRPFPAGYCHSPTAELTKTERDRISTSGPSLQYVTKPGDLFGQISFLFPTRRCTTVDHALMAGGAQRQWHQACLRVASGWNARAPCLEPLRLLSIAPQVEPLAPNPSLLIPRALAIAT